MNAPRIIVNTVSWTGLENFFLSKVTDSKGIQSTVCLEPRARRTRPKALVSRWRSYLSRTPSASIVNKMENLLRTVNMGKLAGEGIHMSTLEPSKMPERSECEYLLQPLGP